MDITRELRILTVITVILSLAPAFQMCVDFGVRVSDMEYLNTIFQTIGKRERFFCRNFKLQITWCTYENPVIHTKSFGYP